MSLKMLNVHNMHLLIFCIILYITHVNADCQLAGNADEASSSQKYLARLEPLKGKVLKYTYADPEEGGDKYEYSVTICSEVLESSKNTGILQHDIKLNKNIVVGRINSTSVKGGTDWIMLTYHGGETYNRHCGKNPRQGHIMITCNPNKLIGQLTVLYEENRSDSEQECFYMLEFDSSAACSDLQVGLSAGSIFMIVLAVTTFLYLTVGMTYKRCVHGAKGVNQIPNIGFWRTCGSLQADGCDYLCRCRDSGFDSSRPYRGIADDQLDEEEADDENLLPM